MTKTVAQRRGILENLSERYEKAQAVQAQEGILIKHCQLEEEESPGVVVRYLEGGMTVAYRHCKGNSFIEVATAVCSLKDLYNRKAGTVLSVENFMNGRVIRVPLLGRTPGEVVEEMFRRHTFLG